MNAGNPREYANKLSELICVSDRLKLPYWNKVEIINSDNTNKPNIAGRLKTIATFSALSRVSLKSFIEFSE